MDELFIVDYVTLNAVPYPSWPSFVLPPSANRFPYSLIKYWRKFSHILLSVEVLLYHLSVAFLLGPPHLESLIIAYLIILTFLSSKYPSGCAEEHLGLLSDVEHHLYRLVAIHCIVEAEEVLVELL